MTFQHVQPVPAGKRPLGALPGPILETWFNPDGTRRIWTPQGVRVLYRCLEGGRGSAKSETVARLLVQDARAGKGRCLCTRTYQSSIKESVHKTIAEAAEEMRVHREFSIGKESIKHKHTGFDFVFRGMQDMASIKSMKGLTRIWVEEAQTVTKDQWMVLEPTLRDESGEIFVTYNPDSEEDATHQMLVVKGRPDAIVREVNWSDNPFFPDILNRQRLMCLELDPDAYDWIWGGKCRRQTNAAVFRHRVHYTGFQEIPEELLVQAGYRLFYGMDFGFADDPTVLVRFYLKDEHLYITHAEFGYHVELDDLPAMMDKVPGSRNWPIKADSSRPETISKLRGAGFNISAAEKWPGSVKDGVAHLKGFRGIHIQAAGPDTEGLAELGREFRLYSYKVDKRQLDQNGNPVILPEIVDKFNHGIDGIRYGLDGYIQKSGGIDIWARLADQSSPS